MKEGKGEEEYPEGLLKQIELMKSIEGVRGIAIYQPPATESSPLILYYNDVTSIATEVWMESLRKYAKIVSLSNACGKVLEEGDDEIIVNIKSNSYTVHILQCATEALGNLVMVAVSNMPPA